MTIFANLRDLTAMIRYSLRPDAERLEQARIDAATRAWLATEPATDPDPLVLTDRAGDTVVVDSTVDGVVVIAHEGVVLDRAQLAAFIAALIAHDAALHAEAQTVGGHRG